MSKFVKLTVEQSNPIGGGYHPNDIYINIDSISYIMQCGDAYRICFIGKQEMIINKENYNTLIKELG